MRQAFIGFFFVVAACGRSATPASSPSMPATRAPPPTTAPAPVPESTAPPTTAEPSTPTAPPEPSAAAPVETAPNLSFAPLPPNLQCNDKTKVASKPATAPSNSAPPPVVGQMTEEAAQAKRLFDSEKWKEAAQALERVARGDTGDDAGNRQIADYHAAIALYRLGRVKEAYAKFHPLAIKPDHVKHAETALWLVKIAEQKPALVQLSDFESYSDEIVARFDNESQKEIHSALSYLVGRQRLSAGRITEARGAFEKVRPEHAYAAAAKACLELIARRGK